MRVKFWGTRGSIPSPGPDTNRYGGNTTCIEVRTDSGQVIILDAGTGIRGLGLELMQSPPVECHVLVSHAHWDHIQGLPFFVPLFVPKSKVHFYGPKDPVYHKSLHELLAGQFSYSHFPVTEAQLNADIDYREVNDGETLQVGEAKVTAVVMNHPVMTLGYRIEADGKSVFFSGDHEPIDNIYEPEDEEYEEYAQLALDKMSSIYECADGVDLFIADSMYTPEEYPAKKGWGHGTYASCLELARASGARTVALTHHEPNRTDALLDALGEQVQALRGASDPQVVVASEGLVFDL